MGEAFLDLIAKYGGFEMVLGFREDTDHFLGGKGNAVWYCTVKGNARDCYIGDLRDGVWTDRHIVYKRAVTEKAAAPGTALKMITERAYFRQAEISASGRRPVSVTLCGHDADHYVYDFGARAYEILREFGVTAAYSNIDDEQAGYRLRNIVLGPNVRPPEFR